MGPMEHCSRVAFDLFDPTGRWNFRVSLKEHAWNLAWWLQVLADTLGRVYSR